MPPRVLFSPFHARGVAELRLPFTGDSVARVLGVKAGYSFTSSGSITTSSVGSCSGMRGLRSRGPRRDRDGGGEGGGSPVGGVPEMFSSSSINWEKGVSQCILTCGGFAAGLHGSGRGVRVRTSRCLSPLRPHHDIMRELSASGVLAGLTFMGETIVSRIFNRFIPVR
jgi:hypothetical protein